MTEARQDVESFKIMTFPIDVLRRILTHADVRTLLCLSETSQRVRSEVYDNALWKHLAFRRFRITPRATTPRRLMNAGPLCWRTLYANWHMQARMPLSRFSGPAVDAFAKGRGSGCFVWMTVVSEDDCRIRETGLRVRVIVQNVWASKLVVPVRGVAFQIRNCGFIGITGGTGSNDDCHARVVDCVTERADRRDDRKSSRFAPCASSPGLMAGRPGGRPGGRPADPAQLGEGTLPGETLGAIDEKDIADGARYSAVLRKDDFCIISAQVAVKGAVFEIDALERMEFVYVPVIVDGDKNVVICRLSDRQIWQCYELLPGGWWARI